MYKTNVATMAVAMRAVKKLKFAKQTNKCKKLHKNFK